MNFLISCLNYNFNRCANGETGTTLNITIMKTINDLKNEVEKTNLTFNEINPTTTDFTGYKFLNTPYCTLLKKHGDNFFIAFDCNDSSNMLSISNGLYKIEIEDDYIYDVTEVKDNTIVEM